MNAPARGLFGETLSPWARVRAADINQRFANTSTSELLHAIIKDTFRDRIAVVSSFGAESAALLHLVAQVDPATPVIFLETGQLFAQTTQYRDELVGQLGLTDVRTQRPDPAMVAAEDPNGDLWQSNPDRCCHLRKVLPLEAALEGFDAWISGRKRYQGGTRTHVPLAEADRGGVKLNPLAHWSPADVDRYFAAHGLPNHPLQAFGFHSIGCHPCTAAITDGDNQRAGRWAGTGKTECGIHRPLARRRQTQIGVSP